MANQRQEPTDRSAQYAARRWPMRVFWISIVGIVLVIGCMIYTKRQTTAPYTQLSVPAVSSQTSVHTATANPVEKPKEPVIGTSPATQIYIPNHNPQLVISTSVQALNGCQSVIDPPHSGKEFGGVFGCTDFAQPGTNSPDLTVIAGHSSKVVNTAFNRLYLQGKRFVGQEVWLKTAKTGSHWLVYRINAVYEPSKADLPYMSKVWGVPGVPNGGRIVVVTCRQQPEVTPAVRNYVAIGQFVGVR